MDPEDKTGAEFLPGSSKQDPVSMDPPKLSDPRIRIRRIIAAAEWSWDRVVQR